MIQTACPLDCYDACGITCDPSFPTRLVATPSHPTSNGALCSLLYKYMHEEIRIEKPTINGVEVSMSEALDATAEALRLESKLLWRGSGNLGVMQRVSNLLMDRIDGYTTYGSLCDGAGQAGILEGRGYNYQLPLEQIAKSEVVVVWGRNLTVTNSHILPYIEGKRLVVIDPISTPIAKRADIHLQIQPRSDFWLAIMLSRFVFMEDGQKYELSDDELEEFYEYTQEFRINQAMKKIGLGLEDIGQVLAEIIDKKVVFLVGAGPQKYAIGHYVFWAIDSLAATLGLFGKEGCGVSYLGNSRQGFDEVFAKNTKKVSMVNTPFEEFDTVLVQGGNPAESMPNSVDVNKSLAKVKNLVYFGLYKNKTSRAANIVIPAKTFLEKDDIRLSYGHQYITQMNKVFDSEIGISEYDFVKEMFKRLDLGDIKGQEFYLQEYNRQYKYDEIIPILPDYQEIPYKDGFGKDGEEDFVFIDEFGDNLKGTETDGYWLLSPKSSKSLNTQFQRGDTIRVPLEANFKSGEIVKVVSKYGECELKIEKSADVLNTCVVVSSGTYGLNNLTAGYASMEGEGACYQDVKVELKSIKSL